MASSKRKLCSYDVMQVPENAYLVTDPGGESHLCNARCLCLWAVQLATSPRTPPEKLQQTWTVTPPAGKPRNFESLADLARWSTANLLGTEASEWSALGAVAATAPAGEEQK